MLSIGSREDFLKYFTFAKAFFLDTYGEFAVSYKKDHF